MNLQELEQSQRIFYSVIAGSYAYGTAIETSDEDYRGYYYEPVNSYLGLNAPKEQINDSKNDIVYYNLKRAFELLKTANPNQIELLWIPKDCVKIYTPEIMDDIIAERKLFITKSAYMSHGAYARAQIKKAKGANKKVHNPQAIERPKKEDFCWIINDAQYLTTCKTSFKPKPLKDTGLDLSEFHVSSLEHSHNMYRLYYYGKTAKGVFRGDDMLVCESISKEDEMTHIFGLLIYNKDAYEKAVKEWSQYWEWMEKRNDSRWVDQESGNLDFDAKNMMHCMRLMMSARNILSEGEPIVRFEGEELDYLRRVRAGEFTYEEIMGKANVIEKDLDKLVEKCGLPNHPDSEKLDKLYRHVQARAEKQYGPYVFKKEIKEIPILNRLKKYKKCCYCGDNVAWRWVWDLDMCVFNKGKGFCVDFWPIKWRRIKNGACICKQLNIKD